MASLTLAVLLLGVYVPVLVWATLAEKWYGSPAVHFGIYETGWFTALHVLLAVNILLAMLLRLPWRRRQLGFLLTHGGVLLLLAGAFITRRSGIEATLSVVEGRNSHVAYRASYHFEITVSRAGQKSVICIPLVTGPLDWRKSAPSLMGKGASAPSLAELPWFPWHLPDRTEGVVYNQGGICVEVLDYVTQPEPSVRVRLTVEDSDGRSTKPTAKGTGGTPAPREGEAKPFDLTLPDPVSCDLGFAERPAPAVVEGRDRRVELALARDAIDLGFAVHLREFHRRLDPGSPMPSHYSSWVDFLDARDPSLPPLQESVVITLNSPVDFCDPRTGRSYRLFQEGFDGPWKPEDPKFDKLLGNDRTRDHVYLSELSVNYDPGRGLKYAGSLLVLLGIALVYFAQATGAGSGG